jgi:hypothetical protein
LANFREKFAAYAALKGKFVVKRDKTKANALIKWEFGKKCGNIN